MAESRSTPSGVSKEAEKAEQLAVVPSETTSSMSADVYKFSTSLLALQDNEDFQKFAANLHDDHFSFCTSNPQYYAKRAGLDKLDPNLIPQLEQAQLLYFLHTLHSWYAIYLSDPSVLHWERLFDHFGHHWQSSHWFLHKNERTRDMATVLVECDARFAECHGSYVRAAEARSYATSVDREAALGEAKKKQSAEFWLRYGRPRITNYIRPFLESVEQLLRAFLSHPDLKQDPYEIRRNIVARFSTK